MLFHVSSSLLNLTACPGETLILKVWQNAIKTIVKFAILHPLGIWITILWSQTRAQSFMLSSVPRTAIYGSLFE